MVIQSLSKHWPARKLEWLMSGLLATWGLYLLLFPSVFTDPNTAKVFSGLADLTASLSDTPAQFWGTSCLLVGVCRAVSLFVNGAWTRTPLIRLVASFVSMFIMTQIVVGMWSSGVPNTGLVVYPWLVIADLLSSYHAAIDVVHAEKEREVQKETHRVDRSSTRLPA